MTVKWRNLPRFVPPQLCLLIDEPPSQNGWVHEVKFDGYRAQLRVQNGKAVLRTRRGLDWTKRFTSIAAAAHDLPDCLIDGEVVVLDKNHMPDFAQLQAALSDGRSDSLTFFAFDLLFDGRRDLRALPLVERKARLKELLDLLASQERIRFVEHFDSPADAMLQSACKLNFEGIVSKRADSPYSSGRSGQWTKAKCRAGQEVVLGGWTTRGAAFRSLLAGVYRQGQLVCVGRIGTGFGRDVVAKLLPKLKAMTAWEPSNSFSATLPPVCRPCSVLSRFAATDLPM